MEVRPGPRPRQVLNEYGTIEAVPAGWELVPPGDAALSRRIKQSGPSMTVVEWRGRKRFSRGIWAAAGQVALLRAELTVERSEPNYERRLEGGRRRRAARQKDYAEDFQSAVLKYLNFHPSFEAQAKILSSRVTDHAVPVGSGTVARTQRIPIEERAAAATLAWLRHHTTGYERMAIPREKGRRREVRRRLAQDSRQLLEDYRSGKWVDPGRCPLQTALEAD